MKTYAGSLQRRGRRWYLVVHKDGRQRWFALKTEKLPLARVRASHIAPPDPNEECAWLEQLVRIGNDARMRLTRMKTMNEITWANLPDRVLATVEAATSDDSRACYVHWLLLIEKLARKFNGSQPGALLPAQAREIVAELARNRQSTGRIVSFLRRSWSNLGLDPDIWPCRKSVVSQSSGHEYYRRLATEEVRKIYGDLVKQDSQLADMVLIGYSTGLRLSDVAELERAELGQTFLRVVPNKTRRRKPNPLRIPLTDEALAAVTRLRLAAEHRGTPFLFDAASRHRPSRRIVAAFRRAGIEKDGAGRASFHSLRATFISLMDEAGIPPHLTDSITGHGGGGMHARYTQPSDAALRAAVVRAIPPLNDPQITRSPDAEGDARTASNKFNRLNVCADSRPMTKISHLTG